MKGLVDYQVGDELPAREWHPTALQIRQYAEASGDFNPIHLDDEFARKAGLKGVIAHGMLTMAEVSVMLTEWCKSQGNVTELEVRFENMVYPGDRIIISGRIKEKNPNNLKCDLVVSNGLVRILTGSSVVSYEMPN